MKEKKEAEGIAAIGEVFKSQLMSISIRPVNPRLDNTTIGSIVRYNDSTCFTFRRINHIFCTKPF